MEHQVYGKFIFLSEESKEDFRNMSDEELEVVASFLSLNILENEIKLMEKVGIGIPEDTPKN